jgi:hypothetical protein
MTARELFTLVLRRWYLMLLGAAMSVGALHVATHQPGVYWTEFNVVLLAPIERYYPNNLADPHYALAPIAGVLATDWNQDDAPLVTASGETTLFGEGQRQGIEIRLPNQGTQWRPLYFAPNINVQIVNDNPETVAKEARRVSADLDALLQRRQDALRVQPTIRLRTIASPAEPEIRYTTGSRPRAALATGLVGAALTTIAVYWIDRWLTRRRSLRVGLSRPAPASGASA